MAGSTAAGAARGEAAAQPAAEPRVAVITTLGCAFCKRAKDALRSAGVPFEEVELSQDLDLLRSIKKSTGLRTVPQVRRGCHAAALLRRTLTSPNWFVQRRAEQVFVGGELLGGATELEGAIERGELAALLGEGAGGGALPLDLRAAVERSAANAQVRPPQRAPCIGHRAGSRSHKAPSLQSRQAGSAVGGLSAAEYARLQELAACIPRSEHRVGCAPQFSTAVERVLAVVSRCSLVSVARALA